MQVVDIGIDVGAPAIAVARVDDLALPRRDASGHKWSAGLMVFGGSTGMLGAPLLAARAGARAGAGMVVCGVPGTQAAALFSGTEIVARALPTTSDGHLDEEAARLVLKELGRFRALAIGPGLGRDDRAQAAARRLIAEAPLPVVVDADALNALAVDASPLRVRHAAGLPPRSSLPMRPSTSVSRGTEWAPIGSKPRASSRPACTRSSC